VSIGTVVPLTCDIPLRLDVADATRVQTVTYAVGDDLRDVRGRIVYSRRKVIHDADTRLSVLQCERTQTVPLGRKITR